jgi:hypothetical protein
MAEKFKMEILPKDTELPPVKRHPLPVNIVYPFDLMAVGEIAKINRSPAHVRQALYRYRKSNLLTAGTWAVRKVDKNTSLVSKISDATAPIRPRRWKDPTKKRKPKI